MQELTITAKNLSVMIVDDAPSMRSLLSAILKGFGITHIYDADDGNAALTMLEKREIDVIFCDWEMPEMTGIELFETLKNDLDLQSIPFVLITSVADLDKVKQAISKGVTNYIVKPFKAETLIEKLNDLFPDPEDETIEQAD